MARAALEQLDLDAVLLVPAAIPPHKRDRQLASGADRLALLALACADEERLLASDVELRRDGISYSYDTACALREELGPGAALFFVIGADTLAELPSWYRIEELGRLVTFCPVTRAGTSLDTGHLRPLLGDEGAAAVARHCLHIEPHPASSTVVRAQLRAGEAPEHLPPGVAEEIRRRGLYRNGGGGATSSDGSG